MWACVCVCVCVFFFNCMIGGTNSNVTDVSQCRWSLSCTDWCVSMWAEPIMHWPAALRSRVGPGCLASWHHWAARPRPQGGNFQSEKWLQPVNTSNAKETHQNFYSQYCRNVKTSLLKKKKRFVSTFLYFIQRRNRHKKKSNNNNKQNKKQREISFKLQNIIK